MFTIAWVSIGATGHSFLWEENVVHRCIVGWIGCAFGISYAFLSLCDGCCECWLLGWVIVSLGWVIVFHIWPLIIFDVCMFDSISCARLAAKQVMGYCDRATDFYAWHK